MRDVENGTATYLTSCAKRSQTSSPASVYSFMTLQIATAWQKNAGQWSGTSEMSLDREQVRAATHLAVVARGQSPPATGRHNRRLEDTTRKDLVLAPLELRSVEEGATLCLGVPSLSRSLCADGGLNLRDGVRGAAARACVNCREGRTMISRGTCAHVADVVRSGRKKKETHHRPEASRSRCRSS